MNEIVIAGDINTMPAHLRAAFGGAVTNNELSDGVSGGYGVISFKGKVWAIREGGTSFTLTELDRGEEVPLRSIEVVIVKANPGLSKVYYQGGYTEGSDEKPMCYSNSGVQPESDSQVPQCTTCAACPHNAWGSRISENGSKGKACADSRRIAVAAPSELDQARLLRIPAATLKDLSQYANDLSKRNAPYQAVVTRIGFDPSVAHPKLTFRAVRWLEAGEVDKVRALMDGDVVTQIVGVNGAPAMTAELPMRPAPLPPRTIAQPVATPVVKATPAPVQAAPAPTAKPATTRSFGAAAPAPVAQAAPVAQPATTRSFGAAAPAPAKPAPAPSKVASRIAEAADDLDAALAELDD